MTAAYLLRPAPIRSARPQAGRNPDTPAGNGYTARMPGASRPVEETYSS